MNPRHVRIPLKVVSAVAVAAGTCLSVLYLSDSSAAGAGGLTSLSLASGDGGRTSSSAERPTESRVRPTSTHPTFTPAVAATASPASTSTKKAAITTAATVVSSAGGGADWSSSSGGLLPQPPRFRAWIFVARSPYLYAPVVSTLQEGFASLGGDARVAHAQDSCLVLEDCRKPAPFRIFVVSIGWMKIHESPRDGCGYAKTMAQVAGLGAFAILYNTEPNWREIKMAPEFMQKWDAQEVWTYSQVPLKFYADANLTVRYIPAGCAAELDVNVSLSAANRNLSHVGFIGNWEGRSEMQRKMVRTAFFGNLEHVHRIYTPEQWRDYLERFPMQVNVHAVWNNMAGFEGLRIAMLVTNWACTLSVRSNPGDEEAFRGIVRFGHNKKALKMIYNSLRDNDTAVQECRQQSRDRFCTRFAPRRLLLDAGFDALLLQEAAAKGAV